MQGADEWPRSVQPASDPQAVQPAYHQAVQPADPQALAHWQAWIGQMLAMFDSMRPTMVRDGDGANLASQPDPTIYQPTSPVYPPVTPPSHSSAGRDGEGDGSHSNRASANLADQPDPSNQPTSPSYSPSYNLPDRDGEHDQPTSPVYPPPSPLSHSSSGRDGEGDGSHSNRASANLADQQEPAYQPTSPSYPPSSPLSHSSSGRDGEGDGNRAHRVSANLADQPTSTVYPPRYSLSSRDGGRYGSRANRTSTGNNPGYTGFPSPRHRLIHSPSRALGPFAFPRLPTSHRSPFRSSYTNTASNYAPNSAPHRTSTADRGPVPAEKIHPSSGSPCRGDLDEHCRPIYSEDRQRT